MPSSLDDRLVHTSKLLSRAAKSLAVVRSLNWSATVRERFFSRGAAELPRVTYRPADHSSVHEAVAEARRRLRGDQPELAWLRRQARAIDLTASLLESVGTRRFFKLSKELYGVPSDPLLDGKSTSIDLARRIDRTLSRLGAADLGSEPEPRTAAQVATSIRRAVEELLGDDAPVVELTSKKVGAKASASTARIRVRRDAKFEKQDIQQLVMHEAMVHVATSINAKRQKQLPILRVKHAGVTRTQEGLAVFSELMSGSLGPARLRELATRALAIQASIDGADFMELYRFHLERTGDPGRAFEASRRIVRGGLLTGGAPFTKDGVYLDGMVRVHNFMSALVSLRRADLLPLLFCGKLDLEDIPALALLRERGLVAPPVHMPPWAQDRRFIVSYLTYSGFLNRIQMARVREHYAEVLRRCPKLR